MASRATSMVTEALLVLAGQLAAVASMLVGIRLLTGLMPPAVYGEFALGLTLATLVSQTAFGPLAQGTMRFYASALEKMSMAPYLAAVRRLTALALAVVGVVLVATYLVLLAIGRLDLMLLATAAFVYTSVSGIAAVMGAIQSSARRRVVVGFHQFLDSALRASAAVGLLLLCGVASSTAMVGYAIAGLGVAGSQYLFYRRLVGPHRAAATSEVATWRRDIWSYSWPFSAWGIFTWAQIASDRWALDWFASRSDVGHFGVLTQFGYGPIQLATAIAIQFIEPILFQRAGDGAHAGRNREVAKISTRVTLIVLGLTAAGFLTTLLLHRLLFRVFVGASYQHVSYLLPWVILAGGIFAAAQSVTLHMLTQLRARIMLTAKICTSLLGIGLNLLGAYLYGVTGVVAASVVFSCACLVWMSVLARAVARESSPAPAAG